MGCKKETENEVIEKGQEDKYPSIENRVFVCIGISALTKAPHYWVMTLNKTCDVITFWETTSNEKFELRGRVDKEERQELINFLKKNLGEGVMNEMVEEDEEKKDLNEKSKKKKGKKVKIEEEEEEEDKGPKEFNLQNEHIDAIPDQTIGLDTLDNKIRATLSNRSTFLLRNKNPLQFVDGAIDTKSKEERKTRGTFIEERRKEEEKLTRENPNKHLKPVIGFTDESGPVEKSFLPYSSLEVIFNHKNVWANMQFPHPGKIKYHLHHVKEWNPYFFVGSHPLDGEGGETWKEKIGTFYSFNSMGAPNTYNQIKKLNEEIYKAVKFGITAARSGANYSTSWKFPKDPQIKHLEKFLRLKEKRDKEVLTKEEYEDEKLVWESELKKLMPRNFRYKGQPMFFSYSDPERIKSSVVKQASSFFMFDTKDMIFALAVKSFPYPGQFNSIRLLLAVFYPIPEEDLEEEENESQADPNEIPEDGEEENLLDGI